MERKFVYMPITWHLRTLRTLAPIADDIIFYLNLIKRSYQ